MMIKGSLWMSISIVKHFQLYLSPKMGLKFSVFGRFKEKNMKDEC